MDPTNRTHNSSDARITVEISERPTSYSDQADRSVPLLPHVTHTRSKPSVFDNLRNFHISLRWWTLDHSSWIGKAVSYLAFATLSIAIPIICILSVHVPHAMAPGIAFYKLAQIPESAHAAIAFFTLARFFHRYGLRHLLFLDGLQDDSLYVRRGYARELDRSFRHLTYILLPSFAVELAHKIIFFSMVSVKVPYVHARVPWNSIMFVAVLASWVYRTGVLLLVCMLFRLTCELQILRLEGFRKLLEGCGSDAGVIFNEHMRIKKQLSVTSHRYRVFIIGCLVTITISQLGALLLVLASKSEKNFFNSGDLVVCSAVQLSGFFMCLMGATRITHRAQGVVAIATRWHMLMTCASNARSNGLDSKNPEPVPATEGFLVSTCGSDSETSDTLIVFPTQDASPFETRQALVTYLQHNNGGITLFGFPLDRGLLHTLFAFEFSLVLWILSKVVVLN
ncbi:uncharacterized protein LOC131217599 [Magnolia sinica]|uniref:uncharacterized protein LOC131217599 n=1 Tax=Magnolia sinica TaxID=86752 RepID=UPI0026599D21|nr:uncharacterized protein LOC131217599 [Magnolia sinica]